MQTMFIDAEYNLATTNRTARDEIRDYEFHIKEAQRRISRAYRDKDIAYLNMARRNLECATLAKKAAIQIRNAGLPF